MRTECGAAPQGFRDFPTGRSAMPNRVSQSVGWVGVSTLFLVSGLSQAQAVRPVTPNTEVLRQRLEEQSRQIEIERGKLRQQQQQLEQTQRSLDEAQRTLDQMRSQVGAPPPAPAVAQPQPATQPKPVGQAPKAPEKPPQVAQIFEQPGVLTPRGQFILEPSLQYGYSTSNRVSLVGYTIIPSLLIGLIDVREVRRESVIGTVAMRYGFTNRFEMEMRVPYVYRSDTSVGREILQGSADNVVFDTSDDDLGDVELIARYQINDGGASEPYYIASLRMKSRTGKDPFESEISTSMVGFRSGIQTELPTGSGFYGLQPGITVLYPSDPAVFFGSFGYLYSFERDDVEQKTDIGYLPVGSVQPRGIYQFNIGMGMALNDRSSFSIGYDHSSVGEIEQDGKVVEDSVRIQLATLLLGFSYRFDNSNSINFSLGAGLTTDTPDITLTLRSPLAF